MPLTRIVFQTKTIHSDGQAETYEVQICTGAFDLSQAQVTTLVELIGRIDDQKQNEKFANKFTNSITVTNYLKNLILGMLKKMGLEEVADTTNKTVIELPVSIVLDRVFGRGSTPGKVNSVLIKAREILVT